MRNRYQITTCKPIFLRAFHIMPRRLQDVEHQIIQQLILDRWNPHRIDHKIANHFGLTIERVRRIRSTEAFQAEHARQLAIYGDPTMLICGDDRRRRVDALQGLYERVPDRRVALKLKILGQIRRETG